MTRCVRWLSLATTALLLMAGPGRCAEIQTDYLMMSDPEFIIPQGGIRVDERLLPLWLEALQRPESEMRRLAAHAIVKARSDGLLEMDAAKPVLLQTLKEPGLLFAARWAIIEALIAIDARETAETLFQQSLEEPRLQALVDPILAAWDYPAARPEWRKRIASPQTDRRGLLLAIRCAAQVRDAEAGVELPGIIRDRERPSDVRLAAARAAGAIVKTGLEPLAGELAPNESAPLVDRLCGVLLLASHTSEDARRLLTGFATDSEPAIAAAGLRTLQSIDPALLLPLAEGAMANPDANVRLEGIRCYVALPTAERIAFVGTHLGDHHPRNRTLVREEFFRLAGQPELDAAVREAAMTALSSEGWREQEQAALLLGALDHKPAGPQLVRLMESTRPEVMGVTAWALRKLALPDLLPAMLDRAVRQSHPPKGPQAVIDPQLAHLFEAFAMMDYRPAIPLMKEYVPMGRGKIARSAAIWSLGHLFKDQPDDELADAFMARFLDSTSMPPEEALVRQMSAVSIGRMKVARHAKKFREIVGEHKNHNAYEYSAAWAVLQITGEDIPAAELTDDLKTGWFLEPLPAAAEQ